MPGASGRMRAPDRRGTEALRIGEYDGALHLLRLNCHPDRGRDHQPESTVNKHIILIHEIYGVTPNLLSLKKELERSGHTVSLPSLYEDGYVGTDEEEAYERFYSQVGIDRALTIIDKIIQQNRSSEITLLGFSVGATIAWLSSRNKELSKVIGIYGSAIRRHQDLEPLAETYLFFTKETSFDVEELHCLLNKKKNVTSAMIPGVHGFYSREEFSSPLIESLNRDIYRIVET